MATPRQLVRDIRDLVAEANGDLRVIWREIERPGEARDALMDILPALVATYGSAASLVAAEWYDDYRNEREVRGRFAAIPATVADAGSTSLVAWALGNATDLAAFQTLIGGGLQQRIATHARLTVADSALADPRAQGWIRVGFNECDWCNQYLDGEVRTVPGYDFNAHDWCQCEALPAF